MPHARRRLGDRGELLAERFLTARGYSILARQYRCQAGEIDLVCRAGDLLAFVEVKTRRGAAFGAPEEAVTPRKLAHVAAAAQHYLEAHATLDTPWRIDVVAIALDAYGRPLETRLIEGVGE